MQFGRAARVVYCCFGYIGRFTGLAHEEQGSWQHFALRCWALGILAGPLGKSGVPHGEARQVVEQLIADVGLRPIRLGNEDQVGLVDSLLAVWFTLVQRQGWGRHLAFKVLSR